MMNPSKKLYGLVGHPIKHSFSPLMHNAAFKELNINGEYRLFEKSPQELDLFLETLDKENIYGLNVTVPYKEKVLNFVELDQESHYLQQIKAVNTIVKQGKIWKGFNTDVVGFSRHLKEVFDASGKTVALLGAGGAARAVVYALVKKEVAKIDIFDIDRSRSASVAALVKELSSEIGVEAVGSIEELDIKNKDLLINATPVGLKETDPCLVKEELLHKDLFVYDLIYNPSETKLLSLARKNAARGCNGLDMLVYQAAFSFCFFTQTEVKVDRIIDIMKKAVEEELKRR